MESKYKEAQPKQKKIDDDAGNEFIEDDPDYEKMANPTPEGNNRFENEDE
jgi:hypothetical protein